MRRPASDASRPRVTGRQTKRPGGHDTGPWDSTRGFTMGRVSTAMVIERTRTRRTAEGGHLKATAGLLGGQGDPVLYSTHAVHRNPVSFRGSRAGPFDRDSSLVRPRRPSPSRLVPD